MELLNKVIVVLKKKSKKKKKKKSKNDPHLPYPEFLYSFIL